MAEEVPEDFLPAVSRDLLPVAVQGMCSGSMPPTLLRRALSVITICMKRTTLMSSEARKEMKQQLKSSKQLVPALCTVVVRDYSSADTKYVASATTASILALYFLGCNAHCYAACCSGLEGTVGNNALVFQGSCSGTHLIPLFSYGIPLQGIRSACRSPEDFARAAVRAGQVHDCRPSEGHGGSVAFV